MIGKRFVLARNLYGCGCMVLLGFLFHRLIEVL